MLLSARHLTRTYGSLDACHNISFDLPEGQIRALIGPNGAGKSTFVGLLSGRIRATSGTVSFAGKDISALPDFRRIALGIAYTFQITSVFPGLSVFENVALAARRTDRRTVRSRVAAALARTGLSALTDQTAGDLSYGHQRLLEIAMGLAQSPRLFILDEPTQGLSDPEIAGFIALIHALKGTTTILLIEHNMDVVMQTADIITVLNNGQILAEGPPAAIRADKSVQSAYLGTPDA